MSNHMEKINEIAEKLAALRADKHARQDDLTVKEERALTEKIKGLMAEQVALITAGASPCKCGVAPHGMLQQVQVKGEPMVYFEIGCLGCADTRSQGFSREQAVAAWNAGKFLKPSKK
jgi:hypothetical protein